MKKLIAIALMASAAFAAQAETRVSQQTSLYVCSSTDSSRPETVQLIVGRVPESRHFFWAQLQGANGWNVRFNGMEPQSFGGNPGLSASQQGAHLTIVFHFESSSADVAFTGHPLLTCDYVEEQTLVNWVK